MTEQGIANVAALTVIGSGIGGYLALVTMAMEPSLFKAAIVHSAVMVRVVSALEHQIELRPQKALATTNMHPDTPGQKGVSSALPSLFELVQFIQGPVLITHGKSDEVAPAEYAHMLALHSFGKPVETAFFNHEGHGYSRWQTRVQVARLQETFLAHHLGRRNGGYDYIELLAKLF